MGRRKKEKRKTSLKQRPAVTTDATVILCRFSTWPSDYERIRTLGGSRVHRTSRPTTTTYRLRARIEPTSFHLRRKKKKKMQLLFPTNNLTCGRRILRRAAQIGAGHISRDIISRRPVHLLSSDDGRIRPETKKNVRRWLMTSTASFHSSIAPARYFCGASQKNTNTDRCIRQLCTRQPTRTTPKSTTGSMQL